MCIEIINYDPRCTHSGVRHEHGKGKGAGELGDAVLRQRVLVEHAADEDLGDGVGRAVLLEEPRGHEGEALGVPAVVGVVDCGHGDEAGEVANGGMGLQDQREGGVERSDLAFWLSKEVILD